MRTMSTNRTRTLRSSVAPGAPERPRTNTPVDMTEMTPVELNFNNITVEQPTSGYATPVRQVRQPVCPNAPERRRVTPAVDTTQPRALSFEDIEPEVCPAPTAKRRKVEINANGGSKISISFEVVIRQ